MKTIPQNNTTTFFSENKKGLIILFVLFLLSSVGMFGQTKSTSTSTITPVTEVIKIAATQVAFGSDVDFMNWFMSSKQTQSIDNGSENGLSTPVSRKKQIISSGIVPNKVLYRTLVKKVISQENAIV